MKQKKLKKNTNMKMRILCQGQRIASIIYLFSIPFQVQLKMHYKNMNVSYMYFQRVYMCIFYLVLLLNGVISHLKSVFFDFFEFCLRRRAGSLQKQKSRSL